MTPMGLSFAEMLLARTLMTAIVCLRIYYCTFCPDEEPGLQRNEFACQGSLIK